MIKVQCDRCKREIEPKADIGYISWCFKEGVDGDLGENILEGQHFCERCMDRIMYIICNFDNEEKAEKIRNEKPEKKPYEKPEIIEVKKRNTGCRLDGLVKRKILEMSEEGKNAKEIAEEMKPKLRSRDRTQDLTTSSTAKLIQMCGVSFAPHSI